MRRVLSTTIVRGTARSLLLRSQLCHPLGCVSYSNSAQLLHRVYVGNIPYRVTESDLASIFSHCGDIVHLNIVRNVVTQQSKGFGFVEFDSPEGVDEALRLTGTVAAGRSLVVKTATPSPADTFAERIPPPPPSSQLSSAISGPNPSRVYVGNLLYSKTPADIAALFHACGPIKYLNVVCESSTGRSKGYAFVEFESPSCAEVALQLHGAIVDGRTLIVKDAAENKREQKHPGFDVAPVPDTVYVANLPEDVLEDDLRGMFDHCGAIDSIRISHSPDFAQTFAHVKFASDECVAAALALSGSDFDGDTLLIHPATRRTPKTF
ncbi:hypothetical protein DYB37_009509 [Aphanomyces astaci]|uniref:RRM domain-containing protein n=1 Tax=Aphanomyces astaci TaxID=112090 RepID=A0A3R7C4B3_APHAT|nr:hypothetical protein DYB35_009197 [Aphanomyces astaci]RHZ32995.1 hypothetical protein DYB37_009509 [Aphanomyces astaci]